MVIRSSIPDPTDRTIETVHREIEQVKEELNTAIANLEDKLTFSLLGREELSVVRHQALDDRLDMMESHRIEREATNEAHRLELKGDNQRTVETAMTAAEKAVNAALAATEKARDQQTIAMNLANAKSETAMTKALEQVTETFKAAFGSLTTQVDDLKLNAGRAMGYSNADKDSNHDRQINLGNLLQLGGLLALYFGLHK
jgi:hypothetical protein